MALCKCGCGVFVKKTWSRGHATRRGRFTKHIIEDRGFESPCWIFHGTLNGNGYGRMMDGPRQCAAHRIYYIQHRGPISSGLQIDHLCRVRQCVNPDHLEAVTSKENVSRSLAWRVKTRGPVWTDAESARLRHLKAARWLVSDIAAAMNRTTASINSQAHNLGVKNGKGIRALSGKGGDK